MRSSATVEVDRRRAARPAAAAAARVTRSTVSMMLAPGWRLRMTSTAGLPLARPALRRSSTESIDLGDVGQPHRRAVAVGDDRAAGTRRRVLRLVVGVDLPAPVAVLDRALRAVGVGRRRARRARPRGRCRTCSARCGLSSTRTAGSELPPTSTWPTPSTCDSFCGRIVEAASYIWPVRQRVRGQRQDQDRRVGRVDLAVGRIAAQVGRQVGARGVDRRLHVARGAVDVAVRGRTAG